MWWARPVTAPCCRLVIFACRAQLGGGDQVHGIGDLHGVLNALNRAYLVLTADKGMAGAYNQNLLKFLKSHCGDDPKARF